MDFMNGGFTITPQDALAYGDNGQRDDLAAGCFPTKLLNPNGLWEDANALKYSLTLLFMQIIIIVTLYHLLVYLFKLIHQPRIVPQILSGLLLCSSVMGRWKHFKLFQLRTLTVLESTGMIGLMYHFFALGVSMEFNAIKGTGKKAILLVLYNLLVSGFIALMVYKNVKPFKGQTTNMFGEHVTRTIRPRIGSVLMGIAASISGFPGLSRILIQLKLFNTDIGKIAMSCSIVETALAWLILPIVILSSRKGDFSSYDTSRLTAFEKTPLVWVIALNIVFFVLCYFVVRPIIRYVVSRTPDGESFSDVVITVLLTIILFFGVITDFICTHVLFGPFVLGLIISRGPLGSTLIGKVEQFGNGLMLPIYFATTGIRAHFEVFCGSLKFMCRSDSTLEVDLMEYKSFLYVFILASLARVVVGFVASQLHYHMTYLEGFILVMVLSIKGLLHIIIINAGFDQEVLNDWTFTFMMVVIPLSGAIITPIIQAIYKPQRHFIVYKRRKIQLSKGDPELRVLPCIHNPRSVPAILNLLGACQSNKKYPLSIYPLHLVEHASHKSFSTVDARSNSEAVQSQPHTEHIINAFENYERACEGSVTVETLIAFSPYPSMHEEICDVAEDKGISFIILPYHKQQTLDGSMEEIAPLFREINDNVLNNAPCSVGVLVDRGLGGITGFGTSTNSTHYQVSSHQVAVLFFGGPDDREALALGWKLSERQNINLTVLRFLPTDDALKLQETMSNDDMGALKLIIDNERERQRDDNYIHDFRTKTSNKASVKYTERLVNDGEETVQIIKMFDNNSYDLFIVGRGRGMVNPLTSGLIDWSECPELGAIGDLLASGDFRTTTSVLIMQQYVGAGAGGGSGTDTPNSSQYCELYDNFHHVNQVSSSPHGNPSAVLSQRRVTKFSTQWH